ncbi:MAG: protein-export membrane protein SecD [Candidatus Buchananbacteria bacterium RIFCSPHIGHO2_01_FULL_39_14]|uniref:Protein translocase subunit SecD n=1 Tax=Candidatus Buchananbacteria bacterium RIFCSPHIGHO2_01_FULL_39_14 TaxID=1797532 RepID=A0A1G1XS71_9BACT|nr:MAG: protein-export membrane protein SecD [Candidatus Buchananbacteria bacterium RIFCSPHIGHO2_01_FULL_39_14]
MNQMTKIRLLTALIFLLAIFSVVIDFGEWGKKIGLPAPNFLKIPYRLGLDLQGGSHLVYQADVSQIPAADQSSAVAGVRDVIERRVNAFGVAEPVVQTTKAGDQWRIITELAGISDINQAIKMIGETPLLEFKEPNPNPKIDLTDEQKNELTAYNQTAEKKAKETLNRALLPSTDFSQLAKEVSEDPGSKENGGDIGFFKKGSLVPEFEKACFNDLQLGQITPQLIKTIFGYHIIKKEEERGESENLEARCRHILIRTKSELDFGPRPDEWIYTGLTGKQLTRAQVIFDPNTQIPQVSLQFNDEGKKLFSEITGRNVGKPVAIFLDGAAISTPTVQEPINDGQAVISGQFTISEAKLLAQRLNAGALPVPINLISQQTVGAQLGNESMTKSLLAGMVSFIIICLFIILYYRLPGLTASLALIFYGLIVIAFFKIMNVTLTLAGIAGFILSLGMAVDANILIFERLKEELKWGKPLSIAINEGFKRAWSSIFDGHVSTLITCFILIGFTTSSVKGFAITLSIGIIASLFSAMTVTKLILKKSVKIKGLTHPWFFGVKKIN